MIAARGKGVISVVGTRLKYLQFPGSQGEHGNGYKEHFNTVTKDDWYPQTGIDAGYTFVVPVGGLYTIWFRVRQPGFSVGGIGFGNGWSGNGSGGAWMRWSRPGFGIVEDNIGVQSWSSSNASDNNLMDCGPTNRNLLAGDTIECYTNGGATGTGVSDWDAILQMTKLRG